MEKEEEEKKAVVGGGKCSLKLSTYQAVEAYRVVGCRGSHNIRQSAHRWWQVCQPYAPAALYYPENLFFCCWYLFLLEAE
jgi:hypothetical protein